MEDNVRFKVRSSESLSLEAFLTLGSNVGERRELGTILEGDARPLAIDRRACRGIKGHSRLYHRESVFRYTVIERGQDTREVLCTVRPSWKIVYTDLLVRFPYKVYSNNTSAYL